MDFRVEFTLTPPEFRTAVREFSGADLRLAALRIWVLAGLIFLLMGALAALSASVPSDLLEPGAFVFAAWMVALPFVLVLVPKLAGREIAPAFLERTEFFGNRESFSVSRSTFAGSGSWEHFSSWRETLGFFVVAHSPSVLLVVPKRALEPDQLAEMREILGQVISQRGG